jgi:Predicted transcriptional regulators containing the CopG/Arc/MetJ DNA-binding domain
MFISVMLYYFIIESNKKNGDAMVSVMKKSISITLEETLLAWIDKELEKARFRNRSHLVEYAILRFKESEAKE